MGMTLNALYALDSELLTPMKFPNLYVFNSGPNYFEDKHFLQGRFWHNEVLYPNIMLQLGHFETLHSAPDTFKHELEMWSKMRLSVWNDMLRTTVQKYVLTHNYDRTEEWTEKRETNESGTDSRNGTASGSASDNTTVKTESETSNTRNGTVNTSESGSGTTTHETSGNRTEETSVSAFNSPGAVNEYTPKEKTVGSDSGTNNGSSSQEREQTVTDNGTESGSRTDKQTDSRTGTSEQTRTDSGEYSKTGGDTFTRSVKAYGNIGVTTAQQMIKEERELITLNMVQYIVDDFKNYFCVMVY